MLGFWLFAVDAWSHGDVHGVSQNSLSASEACQAYLTVLRSFLWNTTIL